MKQGSNRRSSRRRNRVQDSKRPKLLQATSRERLHRALRFSLLGNIQGKASQQHYTYLENRARSGSSMGKILNFGRYKSAMDNYKKGGHNYEAELLED